MRALPAVVAIAVAVALAIFIADQGGNVDITWSGWAIDTSAGVLLGAVVVVAIVLALALMALRFLAHGPRAWRRARREKRRRDGYRALTQGMVAVAAGDAEEAQRLARRADALLAEPPLTLLLSAQAAQLSGDEGAATRYFTAMLERPETEFLGLRGLLMQALKGGDDKAALRLVERAKTLRPRTPWVLASLAELQARAQHWQAAAATLVEADRKRALPHDAARRRHAIVLFEEAREAEQSGGAQKALKLMAKAHALQPAFAPIAALYAQMLAQRGQLRHARRVVAQAWRAAPHPLLFEAQRVLGGGETALERLKSIERLAALNPEHEESRIALAEAALEARLWGEARRHLEPLVGGQDPVPPRLCRLMAAIATSEQQGEGDARAWMARAEAAATLDPAWVCGSCGFASAQWSATCPSCRGFATFDWQSGARTNAVRLPAVIPGAPTAI